MKKKLLIVLITVLLIFTGVFCAGAADKKLVDINDIDFSLGYDTDYNDGKEVKPQIYLYNDNNKRLKVNKDYKVVYKNNKEAGAEATVVITGIKENGYTGKIEQKFTVTPRLPYISFDNGKLTDTSCEIFWQKYEEATGYTLTVDGKTYDTTEGFFKVEGLKPETPYCIRLSSYAVVNGKRIESRNQDECRFTTREEGFAIKKYTEDDLRVVIDNVVYTLNRTVIWMQDTKGEFSKKYSEYADSYAVSGVDYNKELTEITVLPVVHGLPVTYFDIDESSFPAEAEKSYPAIKKLNLPSTIKAYGSYDLKYFTGVEELIVPEGVKEFEKSAFGKMTSLKRISLPDSLETIPSFAFYACDALEKINIPKNIKKIGYKAFDGLQNLKEVVIEGELEEISQGAFRDCKKLTKINFPDSIREIGPYAFRRSGVTEVTIPDECHFSYHSFRECENLKKVTIKYTDKKPYGYTIPKYAFQDCKNLEAVYFTALTIELDTGKNAFKGCDKLKDIYYFGNKAQWQDVCMTGERAYTYDKCQLHTYYDHVHSYIEIGQTHTCKKGTVVKLRCKCGDEYEYVLNNTNTHNYTSWKVVKKPTLKTKGKAERICTVCENKETKTLVHIGTATLKTQSKKYSYSAFDLPKPNVFVKDGNKSLKKGVHYKITGYKNNDKPGYGIATVKGVVKNGYYGTATIKYAVMPKGAYSLKAAKITSSSVKLTWKNEENLNGYIIYLVDEVTGKETKIGTTDKLTYTVKNLEGKTNYKFKVLGYIIADGNKITGHYSTVKVKTK